MKTYATVIVLLLLAFAPARAQRGPATPKPEQYLCVTDHSAGMAYNAADKSWHSTTFRPDAKYIVSKSDRPNVAFQVTQVGQSFTPYLCKEPFDEYGYLECRESENSISTRRTCVFW